MVSNNPKDYRTTVSGVVAGVSMILRSLGIGPVPDFVLDGVTALSIFLLGLFSRDRH